jgi:NDP-sugar pyrophosphorylase family protein
MLPYKLRIPLSGQIEIALRGALRLLLKAVQHIDGIFEPGNINHTEDPGFIFDPKFLYALSHIRHWFEIGRLQPILHAVKLVSGVSPRVPWKVAKVMPRGSPELEFLYRGLPRHVRHT